MVFLGSAAFCAVSACDGKLAHRREGVVRVQLPVPRDVHRLVVEVDSGSITILGEEEASDTLIFEGECLRAADDAETLRVLEGVDLTLRPSQEGDLLHLEAPPLPEGVTRDRALMVVRGVLKCPARLEVTARTGRGSLKASGIAGGVDLNTELGDIALAKCGGVAKVATEQGAVLVDGHAGALSAHAKTGSVRAFLRELTLPGLTVAARSEVEVNLPRRDGFELSARTERGLCHNGFGVKVVLDGLASSMAGVVNGGGPKVDLRSSEGSVTVGVSD